MVEKKKRYPNPKFSSLEEERAYWETHSPLVEGYEGKVQQNRQKRSSFLAVRLTGEELTRLRDTAAKRGLGPSTFARLILMAAIEEGGRSAADITLNGVRIELERKLAEHVSAYHAPGRSSSP